MKSMLRILLVSAAFGMGILPAAAAEDGAKVTPVMSKDLQDYPGKEALMLSVEYEPGASSPSAFHRLDAAGADGLGIGLFVVRRAAELLGHGIEVRSRAGEGSRFSVLARAGE
jgi:hypothetical protein